MISADSALVGEKQRDGRAPEGGARSETREGDGSAERNNAVS